MKGIVIGLTIAASLVASQITYAQNKVGENRNTGASTSGNAYDATVTDRKVPYRGDSNQKGPDNTANDKQSIDNSGRSSGGGYSPGPAGGGGYSPSPSKSSNSGLGEQSQAKTPPPAINNQKSKPREQ